MNVSGKWIGVAVGAAAIVGVSWSVQLLWSTPLLPSLILVLLVALLHWRNERLLTRSFDRRAYILVSLVVLGVLGYQTTFGNVPLSGNDWEGYERHAANLLDSGSLWGAIGSVEVNLFPKLIAGVYTAFGQVNTAFVHILVYCTSIIGFSYIVRLSGLLNVEPTVRSWIIFGYLLTPINLVFSVSYLREAPIQALLLATTFHFGTFIQRNAYFHLAISVSLASVAALLHSGMVVLLFAIVFIAVHSDRNTRNLRFNITRVGLSVLSLAGIFLIARQSALFTKFGDLDEERIVQVGGYSAGNTAYVTDEITSLMEFVIAIPMRLIYFILSPLPWQVYDVPTAVALVLTAVPQWIMLYGLIRFMGSSNRNQVMDRRMEVFILVTLIAGWIVFAMGTANFGTAIRHRAKFNGLLWLVAAVGLGGVGPGRKPARGFRPQPR